MYRHKPKHILTSKKVKFRQCLCDICYNAVSMTKCINKFLKVSKTVDDWVAETMCECESQTISCVRRLCELCGCETIKQNVYDSLDVKCLNEEVRFVLWENVEINGKKKMCKVTKQVTVSMLVESFFSRLGSIALHRFTDRWQRSQYKSLKANLPQKTCLFVLDFAENYTCKAQDEAQSAYWSNSQVTVHPIVSFVKCTRCNETCTHNLVFLSDDRRHDSHAVQAFFLKAKSYIASVTPLDRIYIVSDGAAAHYKSKIPFFYLSNLDITADKIFFGARHGKSECDALGGTVKSLATTLVASNPEIVIDDAKSLFEECSSRFSVSQIGECGQIHKSRTFFLVDTSEIIREEHAGLKAIPQTRSLHHIRKVRPNVLAVRKLSCFCPPCREGRSDVCENADWVGEWEFVKLAECNASETDSLNSETDDSVAIDNCLRIGAFHIVVWNSKDYVAQILVTDGHWVHLSFMKWHIGKLCWGEEDLSWEERDVVGCEVELKLDEVRSTQRKQYFTYEMKMPHFK